MAPTHSTNCYILVAHLKKGKRYAFVPETFPIFSDHFIVFVWDISLSCMVTICVPLKT